nr:MAG TPA: hypothetical protein [Caudoviricetes sp.]
MIEDCKAYKEANKVTDHTNGNQRLQGVHVLTSNQVC